MEIVSAEFGRYTGEYDKKRGWSNKNIYLDNYSKKCYTVNVSKEYPVHIYKLVGKK